MALNVERLSLTTAGSPTWSVETRIWYYATQAICRRMSNVECRMLRLTEIRRSQNHYHANG